MLIISGQNSDLITPFPPAEVGRIFGWNHCYRTLVEDDALPTDKEEFTRLMEQSLPHAVTCGIVDKGQLTSSRHEAPLVGLITYTPVSARDGIIHFASGRKAFKMGLVEEGLSLFIPRIFESSPAITRLSAVLDEANTPAKGVLRRVGFRFEGVTRDAVVRGGIARSQVQFGLTRQFFTQPAQAEETECN